MTETELQKCDKFYAFLGGCLQVPLIRYAVWTLDGYIYYQTEEAAHLVRMDSQIVRFEYHSWHELKILATQGRLAYPRQEEVPPLLPPTMEEDDASVCRCEPENAHHIGYFCTTCGLGVFN